MSERTSAKLVDRLEGARIALTLLGLDDYRIIPLAELERLRSLWERNPDQIPALVDYPETVSFIKRIDTLITGDPTE